MMLMYYNSMDPQILAVRRKQVLYDEKWRKFLKRSWPFRYLPFVEFVLAAGSMATGNVKPDSDFDVIAAVKKGRIFTARFFAVAFFGVLGWRRRKLSHREAAADKICLNHFVTEDSYRLTPPYNSYWIELYRNLVPVFGEVSRLRKFWLTNKDWLGEIRDYRDDLRHRHREDSFFKKAGQSLLGGSFGNLLEQVLKRIQVSRIEKSLKSDPPGFKPRIRYSDDELEFHPDTKRIEEFINRPTA